MKLAIASIFDPWSPQSWSGCSRNLLRSLVDDYGVTPVALGPISTPSSVRDVVLRQVSRLQGRHYISELTEPSLRYFAARTAEKLKGIDCDGILALDGHTIAYLKTELPTYYFWDCTFEGNLEYPWFANLAAPCITAGHSMERNAVRKASISFYSSRWAIDSAIGTYGADPERTKIVPLAANIDCNRTEVEVEKLISERSTETIQLLFLGVDWQRKGGDLALAITEELNARGKPAVLHVVGCAPDSATVVPDFVCLHGFLNKGVSPELVRLQFLIGSAHFLIVPSLAEAFGAVFAEASSFGTPSLARRIGGIDSVVVDGVNGYLFDRNAASAEYCNMIESLWDDPQRYEALARSSFQHFRDCLTWNSSAGKLFNYIESDLRCRAKSSSNDCAIVNGRVA